MERSSRSSSSRLWDGERTSSRMAKQPCTCGKAITAKYSALCRVVQLVLLTGLLRCSLAIQSPTLRIGFLSSGSTDEKMPRLEREIYGGLLVAAESINTSPKVYRNVSFSIERRLLLKGEDPSETLQQLFNAGIATVFGYPEICEQLASASATRNRIMISPVCGEDKYSDKRKYSTFLRTRPSHAQIALLLARLMAYHKINSAAAVVQNSSEWISVYESFERQAQLVYAKPIIVNKTVFNDNERCCSMDLPCCHVPWSYEFYEGASTLTNTFLFFGDYRHLKQLSKTIQLAEGASANKYLILSLDMEAFSSTRLDELAKKPRKRARKQSSLLHEKLEETWMAEWKAHERRIETGSLPDIILVARGAHNAGLVKFESRVRDALRKVLPSPLATAFPVTIQAAYAYDALMVYADAVASQLDPLMWRPNDLHRIALDGKKLFNLITHKSNLSSAKGGKLVINSDGDTSDYFIAVGTKRQANYPSQTRDVLVPIGNFRNYSYNPSTTLPRFISCGPFYNNPFEKHQAFNKHVFFVSYAIVNLLIADLVIHYFLYALRKRVKTADGISLKDDSTTDNQLYEELSNNHLVRIVNCDRVTNNADDWKTPAWCTKLTFQNREMIFHGDTLKEMYKMRTLRHSNVATFFTAVVRKNELFMISEYQDMGTLEDILSNEAHVLIPRTVYSMINSLVDGMIYLHDSFIGYHGDLKPSNCLVNSNWKLKITGFGIQSLRRTASTHRDLLWSAPEIMRSPEILGSQEGDVYSFAIIMHEVVYRLGPYAINISHKEPADIVRKVSRPVARNKTPYRPPIGKSSLSSCHSCMRECWAEDPEDRPTFRDVLRYLEKSCLRTKSYTTGGVVTATEELVELQQQINRMDEVLHSIIPKSIANRLANGEEVQPELWENVTVFEADLVGFTEIARERTPLGTLILLDDLYKLFDSIARGYNVCKMDTEGDAYIVVSHARSQPSTAAGEIASMALEFVEGIKQAKISHKGKPVVVRIGVHTGPVAAGVVGSVHPTFSIFGDTVKIASDMQSTSAELRIQLSEDTYRALQEIGGYITEERQWDGFADGEHTTSNKTYWLIGHEKQITQRKRTPSCDNLKPLCNRQSIISLSSTDFYVEPLNAQ